MKFTKYLREEDEKFYPFGDVKHAESLKREYADAFKTWKIVPGTVSGKKGTFLLKDLGKLEYVRVVVEDLNEDGDITLHVLYDIPATEVSKVWIIKETNVKKLSSEMDKIEDLNETLETFQKGLNDLGLWNDSIED